MKCGLVILNYKDYKTTQKLLDAVKDFPEIDHIAVVDNDSQNESYDILKQYTCDKISVLRSGSNRGYSYGNNIGIRYLIKNFSPDIIGIANPDVVFSNDYVKRIKELFTKNEDYAIITGLETTSNGRVVFFFMDKEKEKACTVFKQEIKSIFSFFPRILRKVSRKISHVKIKPLNKSQALYIDKELSKGTELIQVWKVHGAMFFVRVSDFQTIGLFDENIFMYREEEVLAFRIHSIHKKIGVAPDLKFVHLFIHYYSGNVHSIMPYFRMALSYKNSKIYYFNHYVSGNKFLQAINWLLSWVNMLRECIESLIRFIINLFTH